MSTPAPFESNITPGEAIMVRTSEPFADRVGRIQAAYAHNDDVVISASTKILIDDIRSWSDEFRKSSIRGVSFGLEGSKVSKLGILVFDEILIPAQNILLKELEDISSDESIILSVHTHTVLLPTVLSRVVSSAAEVAATEKGSGADIFPDADYFKNEKNVSKRLERMKKITEAYDEERLSKQDIVVWIESLPDVDPELRSQVILLLKQPSTLVKYVLEFLAGMI